MFSQFLCFCGVKVGYNFLLEVFQVLSEIDHTTVIQAIYITVLCCGFL